MNPSVEEVTIPTPYESVTIHTKIAVLIHYKISANITVIESIIGGLLGFFMTSEKVLFDPKRLEFCMNELQAVTMTQQKYSYT